MHYKGNCYRILALGMHSETGEELVTYQRIKDGSVYSRPKAMFFDEVEKDGRKMTRFTLSSAPHVIMIETLGWYGALGLLAAYALLSLGVFSQESAWYHILNLTAALGIVAISLYRKAYQPAVLNIVWAAVGAIALIGILS